MIAALIASIMLALAVSARSQAPTTRLVAERPTSVAVMLAPGDPASKLAPRYSPPGRRLKLEPRGRPGLAGFDHVETRLKLGPNAESGEGHLLVLARGARGKPYNLLYVDADGTGKLDATPIVVKPNLVRGKVWTSFQATLRVDHARPGAVAAEDYPVSFWAVVDQEGDTPAIIRVSRRGFLIGSTRLGRAPVEVVLSDGNNDGVLGPGDWWELRVEGSKSADMRTVGDFAWAGGQAWKLEPQGTSGRRAKLVAFDPGITEEEDAFKRDAFREDRLAERAAKPVAFRQDIDTALKDAARRRSACFLKFEADWCGPCKLMSSFVFTAKAVADAVEGLTCIVIDGDARKDLTAKHAVNAYPTGILLDADGREIARYVGYRSVEETTAFLKKRRP
jgi:thiol-disulfide isomerase/thioredoxin